MVQWKRLFNIEDRDRRYLHDEIRSREHTPEQAIWEESQLTLSILIF